MRYFRIEFSTLGVYTPPLFFSRSIGWIYNAKFRGFRIIQLTIQIPNCIPLPYILFPTITTIICTVVTETFFTMKGSLAFHAVIPCLHVSPLYTGLFNETQKIVGSAGAAYPSSASSIPH
jgi:hypothetical protein